MAGRARQHPVRCGLGQGKDAFPGVFTHQRQVGLAENQKQISRQRLGHMLEGKPNKPGPRLQFHVFAEKSMTKAEQ